MDKGLRRAHIDYLTANESAFWKSLINKYLCPLDNDPDHQLLVSKDLKELRNRVTLGYFMLNALFVTIVLILQLRKDELHIVWPIGVRETLEWVRVWQYSGNFVF